MREKMDRLRVEWSGAMEELLARGFRVLAF